MLRTAIIGLGYWGPNYARLLNGIVRGAQLVACADRDGARLGELSGQYPGIQMFEDHRQMLAACQVDAAIIATPTSSHLELALDCMEGGLDVLIEKPLAMTSADAQQIVDRAAERGRKLMVGHTFLFNPAVRLIKRYIDERELGRILYLSFTRTGLGPIRQDVNALWDLAPHDLSMLRYWLGADPVEVTAQGQSYLKPGMDDVVFVTLRYPNSVLAAIHLSWLDPVKDRKVTIVGDRKMVVFDDVSQTEKLRIYDKGVSYQPRNGDFADFVAAVRDGDITIPTVDTREPLREQLEHFVDCIVNGKQPLADGAQGVAVVRTLEQAQAVLDRAPV
jgi:predicted dehydrogenase